MVITLITTTFSYVPMISLTFKVLFVKLCGLMLCLGLSVPEDVPVVPRARSRCSRVLSTLIIHDKAFMVKKSLNIFEYKSRHYCSIYEFCPHAS